MKPTAIVKTSRQPDRRGFKSLLPSLWPSFLFLRSTQSDSLTTPRLHTRDGLESHTMPAYEMLVPSDVGGNAYSYCDEL